MGSLKVASYRGVHMGWPLKVRGSLQSLEFKFTAAAISIMFKVEHDTLAHIAFYDGIIPSHPKIEIALGDICRFDIC